jgi:Rrf2 family transcriptional regulator, iron-sulfur cluster assembly transcription factor
MIFSHSTEYAIRGLSELAARNDGSNVRLDQLAADAELPRDFLAKIFQRLVRGGVLESRKGRGGGFALARPAHEVTLMDILQAMEGEQTFDQCVIGLERCNDTMPCSQHDLYKPIRQRLKDYLTTTTLADLASSLRSKQAWQRLREEQVQA